MLKFFYEGQRFPELLNKAWTVREIAEHTGIKSGALRNRLRYTDLVKDEHLYEFKERKGAICWEFVGSHAKLITGKSYTAADYADAAGVDSSTMWGRIKMKDIVSDNDLRAPDGKYSNNPRVKEAVPQLETHEERLSDKWLRMKL
ncbi:hypothetical protein N9000_01105 [bacterium]|nr:hypothetical protein [bacterium]